MSDMDHKPRFFFAVAFMLSALTTTFFTSSVMAFTMNEGNSLSLSLTAWQQGTFVILLILNCLLVFFLAVFFMLATLYGILELRLQFRKFKQAQMQAPSPRASVNPRTSYQQRSRGYRN